MMITVPMIRAQGAQVAKPAAQRIDPVAYAAVPAEALFAQQGDIYLKKLEALPEGAYQVTPFRQLVPGATLGSRHCLETTEGVAMYALHTPTALEGPIIVCSREVAVTHPVHGDIVGIPAGSVFQVTYQRQLADALRRVAD